MGENEIESLKSQLSKTYQFSFFPLKVAGEDFELATVTNIDELFDNLIARGPDDDDFKDERIPYWADLWHSAIGLAEFLIETRICEGKSVLEIGCGLGMAGVAAAKTGGKVILTDYIQDALDVAKLIWYMNLNQQPDLRILDWRKPSPELASDILLASDVAYEERNFKPLLEAFRVLLKPGGTILLSDPGRPLGKNFTASLKNAGYKVKSHFRQVRYRNVLTKVQIFQLTFPS